MCGEVINYAWNWSPFWFRPLSFLLSKRGIGVSVNFGSRLLGEWAIRYSESKEGKDTEKGDTSARVVALLIATPIFIPATTLPYLVGSWVSFLISPPFFLFHYNTKSHRIARDGYIRNLQSDPICALARLSRNHDENQRESLKISHSTRKNPLNAFSLFLSLYGANILAPWTERSHRCFNKVSW